jgi:hypothetical protein
MTITDDPRTLADDTQGLATLIERVATHRATDDDEAA